MLVSAPTLLLAALSCTTDATLRTFCTPTAPSNVAGHQEQALARAPDVHKLLNSSSTMLADFAALPAKRTKAAVVVDQVASSRPESGFLAGPNAEQPAILPPEPAHRRPVVAMHSA